MSRSFHWRHRLIGRGHECWYNDQDEGLYAHIRSLDHGKHWAVGRGNMGGVGPFIERCGGFTDIEAAKAALLVTLATR